VSELNKAARTVIDAVARTISPTWNPPDSHIFVSGKRIGLQAHTLKRLSTGENAAKLRLRFDKVANRVTGRLRAAAVDIVPGGMTVVVTITAPIRLASKTAASLEGLIRSHLAQKRTGRDAKATIHGNRVRVRILKKEFERTPKLIAFVHNSDSDSELLLDITQEMLELFCATQNNVRVC
jgi:hypothetical protein